MDNKIKKHTDWPAGAPDWHSESTHDPRIAQEAIDIAEGRCNKTPTVTHLQALIERFGGTASESIYPLREI